MSQNNYPFVVTAQPGREFPGFSLNSYPLFIFPGSLGFDVVNARFWGVSGVYTPLTPFFGTNPLPGRVVTTKG